MSKFLVRRRGCQRVPPLVQPKYGQAYKGEQKQPALGITAYPLQDTCLEGGPFAAGLYGWSGGMCWKKGRRQTGRPRSSALRFGGGCAPPTVSNQSSLAPKR